MSDHPTRYAATSNLTRFVVRAPREVVSALLNIGADALSADRPWFTHGIGPSTNGRTFVVCFAGEEDAARVRDLLRDNGIPEGDE